MNSTAQLPGVNRPLSVELRLINVCSCALDSHGKHNTSFSRGVLTKRSDFPRAKGAVRCSPFGGVEFGKTSRLGSLTSQASSARYRERLLAAETPAWNCLLEGGAYGQFAKTKRNNGAETPDSAVTKEFLSCESGWSKTIRRPLKLDQSAAA